MSPLVAAQLVLTLSSLAQPLYSTDLIHCNGIPGSFPCSSFCRPQWHVKESGVPERQMEERECQSSRVYPHSSRHVFSRATVVMHAPPVHHLILPKNICRHCLWKICPICLSPFPITDALRVCLRPGFLFADLYGHFGNCCAKQGRRCLCSVPFVNPL